MPPHIVYIINRDRLTSTRRMVTWLAENVLDIKMVIIDNDSSYPPLLEWYQLLPTIQPTALTILKANTNLGVVRIGNHGPYSGWATNLIDHDILFHNGYKDYFVTDSDLDISGCPPDTLSTLSRILHLSLEASAIKPVKVGLSLEIEDLPDNFPGKTDVRNWEAQYWRDIYPDSQGSLFWSGVDTTFACYPVQQSIGRAMSQCPALRINRPYTARHLPWYITPETITEEEKYVLQHSAPQFSHWSKIAQQYTFVK